MPVTLKLRRLFIHASHVRWFSRASLSDWAAWSNILCNKRGPNQGGLSKTSNLKHVAPYFRLKREKSNEAFCKKKNITFPFWTFNEVFLSSNKDIAETLRDSTAQCRAVLPLLSWETTLAPREISRRAGSILKRKKKLHVEMKFRIPKISINVWPSRWSPEGSPH